tara:strand:- start:632 stop:1006 length:375 start_codon:yes stop_codon:yes gene_type:complete
MKAKVRFHLGRGPNYQRWQVKQGESIEYYDPEDVILEMHNAKLCNQRKTAERICAGENKTVCAWVECDDLVVLPSSPDSAPQVRDFAHYNPKRRPFWHNAAREDLDNTKYSRLATYGKLIIIPT